MDWRNLKQRGHLDQIDRRILGWLQNDATLSHSELADRVSASAASCWRRIKSLEAAGILGKTVRLVHQEAIGRGVNVMCNIRMNSHDIEAVQNFEEFVQARPEIIECFSMSGEWDYLLRVVVADVSGYNQFLMQTVLRHPSVGGGSSHFVLALTKYTTALPV